MAARKGMFGILIEDNALAADLRSFNRDLQGRVKTQKRLQYAMRMFCGIQSVAHEPDIILIPKNFQHTDIIAKNRSNCKRIETLS